MVRRRGTIVLAGAIVATLTLAAPALAQDLVWVSYENPRFGYRLEYPAALFGQPLASQNGDGFTLYSPDGRARFFAFASNNVFGHDAESLAGQLATAADIDRVTYRRVAGQWLVLSGYLATGDIFYQRFEFNRDDSVISAFRLEFPATARDPYEAPIARIGRSLTPPRP
jgi:hypothetical protein